MADYLYLVNKVLEESGKEQNLLTEDTWDSSEAGRRLYPRVKRLVRESWKMIQMRRNEWEFNTGRITLALQPKIRFVQMSTIAAPEIYEWTGQSSGVRLAIMATESDYNDSTGYGAGEAMVEFLTDNASMVLGETFVADIDDSSFVYNGPGSHSLNDGLSNRVREPRWETMRLSLDNEKFFPLNIVPFDNYLLTRRGNTTYVAKDYKGNLVLFAQLKEPALLQFDFDMAPQTLEDWDDTPEGLPEEYHDWIAWEALESLAKYDKDPILLSYAQSMADVYRRRAERNLLPMVSWQASKYDYPNTLEYFSGSRY